MGWMQRRQQAQEHGLHGTNENREQQCVGRHGEKEYGSLAGIHNDGEYDVHLSRLDITFLQQEPCQRWV